MELPHDGSVHETADADQNLELAGNPYATKGPNVGAFKGKKGKKGKKGRKIGGFNSAANNILKNNFLK